MRWILVCLGGVTLLGCADLPDQKPIQQWTTLQQNWEPGWEVGQAQWFHHASQGTKMVPYDWFMALEQPGVLFSQEPFSDTAYLERFGFIPSDPWDGQNPDGLPIGFSVEEHFQEPDAKQPYDPSNRSDPYEYARAPYKVVGITCAACHTGQIDYQGTAIRIDGGSAMVNLRAFQTELSKAMFLTDLDPIRFKRFAQKVLGGKYEDEQAVKVLKDELHTTIQKGLEEKRYSDEHKIIPVVSGFSRTDALALIGNRVFGQLGRTNIDIADAPVNFPHIWDTSWYEWVQYNSSIRLPMIRNIGEALGVGAQVNLNRIKGKRFKSTVNVKNLHLMEDQLGGDEPFSGLRPPKWPELVLGKLDVDKVSRGRKLYDRHCASCHLPPAETLKTAHLDPDSEFWTEPNAFGKRFLKLKSIDLEQIGTDPGQALNIYRRLVHTNGRTVSAAKALYVVAGLVRNHTYRDLGLTEEDQAQWNRFREQRKDQGPPVEANLAYKAKPLNGIWATPPYLHNSSIPNLYELLLPAQKRSKKFYLGSKSFDPVNVGYEHRHLNGGFLFDTTVIGNHNTGHEFRDVTKEEMRREGWRIKGVIGPALSELERWDLIEYLKSL